MNAEEKKLALTTYMAVPLLKGKFLAGVLALQIGSLAIPFMLQVSIPMAVGLGLNALFWMTYAVLLESSCARLFNRAEAFRLLLNRQAIDKEENLDGTKEVE